MANSTVVSTYKAAVPIKPEELNSILSGGRSSQKTQNEDNLNDNAAALSELLFSEKGVHICAAHALFQKIDVSGFERIVEGVCAADNPLAKNSLLFYLKLFRKEPHLRVLMRDSSLPLDFIYSVICSVISQSNASDEDENVALEETLEVLPKHTLYELAVKTSTVSKAKSLVLYFLSKMDTYHIDLYFQDLGRVKNFIILICSMPERFVRSYFFNNPEIHGFYVFLLHSIDIDDIPNANEVCRLDLAEVAEIKRIESEILKRFNLEAEIALPLSKRNTERYALIVRCVRSLKDVLGILISLENKGVIDSQERSLIEQILGNPIFRDVLEVYERSAAAQIQTEEKDSGVVFF